MKTKRYYKGKLPFKVKQVASSEYGAKVCAFCFQRLCKSYDIHIRKGRIVMAQFYCQTDSEYRRIVRFIYEVNQRKRSNPRILSDRELKERMRIANDKNRLYSALEKK
jgi:hypothetical protein